MTVDAVATGRGNRLWHNNSLSIVLFGLFAISMAGQVFTGWSEYNQEARVHGDVPIALPAYFGTGHFWEATGENWESEFLQMAMFVILTALFRQKGSAESKRIAVVEEVDLDPERFRDAPDVPGPVRHGGWRLAFYKQSLSFAFAALFVGSFVMHGLGGWHEYNEDRRAHREGPIALASYLESSRFWFESFQNWQSEFLSLAVMVVGTIYLRQFRSGESKPVHAPHAETGRG
jgi:hypothetical protein